MNKLVVFICVSLFALSSIAQGDPTVYRKENLRNFKFEPFERSFSGVDPSMDSLVAKPGSEWGAEDSLQFAINIAKLGNHGRAYRYLKKIHLRNIENTSIPHLVMIYQLNQRYDIAEKWMKKYETDSPESAHAKKIWLNMLRLRKDLVDMKVNLKYETVFKINDQVSYTNEQKKSEKFKEEVIQPLEGGEIVLRFHIMYLDQKDPVLSKLSWEMGDVIRQHLSLTMAYVAYSLAKHYDGTSDNAKRVKNIKTEIHDAKYEILPLKKFFPKKRKNRFNLENIREIHEEEKVKKHKIPPFEEEVVEPLWLSTGFILTAGLLLILLLVILFIRTKKK